MAGQTVNNEMLWLEGDDVICHPDFMSHPAYIELENRDKRGGKQQFKKWLRYLYDAYRKEHAVYKNTLPTERKRAVCRMLGQDSEIWKEWDEMMKDVIALYVNVQYSHVENMIRKLVDDMDEFIIQLQNTKWSRTIRKTVTIAEGAKEEIYEEIDVDRKTKYYKAANDIFDMAEKYKKMLIREFKESSDRGLFEQRNNA